jgi:hypothetical protein
MIKTHGIKIKYENEYFVLKLEDLKSLNFEVQPGTSDVELCVMQFNLLGKSTSSICRRIGKEAIVTLKVTTKAGVEVINKFSTADDGVLGNLCPNYFISFISKLTDKEITKKYSVTNLKRGVVGTPDRRSKTGCFFHKGTNKEISSIIFKG